MTPRARQRLLAGATVGLSAAAVLVLPPPEVLQTSGVTSAWLFAALAAAAITGVAVVPVLRRPGLARPPAWIAVAVLALVAGVGAYLYATDAQRRCTARYDGRATLIGTEWTELGATYHRDNPALSPDELLFDAAGVPDRLWTRSSIDRCRLTVAWTYFLWIPLLAVCLFAAAQVAPPGLWLVAASPGSRRPATVAAGPVTIRYDVFISYRHGGTDTAFARTLLGELESHGYTVAIDERDFLANASFLQEMERCIRESRHTVAVMSPRYIGSGHCEEEAIICKVLDMGDRRRRLIPMIVEPVPLPAWLYGLVGIDCTKPDPLIDPFEKLRQTLGPPGGTPAPA